ncbi:hypothetical protein ES703_44692 [subsurface metagenome]
MCRRGRSRSSCKKREQKRTTSFTSKLKQTFRVIHPFHSLYSKEFKVHEKKIFHHKEYIVFYNEQAEMQIIPVLWSSLSENKDIFKIFAKGKAYIRFNDLLSLVELIHHYKDLKI